MKTCSIEGCGRRSHARGWCNAHYLRWFHHGDTSADFTRRTKPCATEGCERQSFGLGLCANHYKQEQYRRNPEKYRAWEARRRLVKGDEVRAKDRKRYATDRTPYRVRRANRSARERGADGSHTTAEWLAKLAEYGGLCAYCGKPGDTRDHVIPISRGGSNYIDNIVPACLTCNLRKNAKTGDEFRALLFQGHRGMASEHLLRLGEEE